MSPKGPILVLACAFGIFASHPGWAATVDSRPLLDTESLASFETAASAPLESNQPTARQNYRHSLSILFHIRLTKCINCWLHVMRLKWAMA